MQKRDRRRQAKQKPWDPRSDSDESPGFPFCFIYFRWELNKAATQKGQQTQIRQVSRKACPLQQNDGEGDSQDGARLGNNNYFFPDKWRKKKKVSAESRLPPSLG